jgi:hypothetical protein
MTTDPQIPEGESGPIITVTRSTCVSPQMCVGCWRAILANAWSISLSGTQGKFWICDACAAGGAEAIRAQLLMMRETYAAAIKVLAGIEHARIEIEWTDPPPEGEDSEEP